MKAVILAGGIGSRLSEETTIRPKPLVEIGGYPILWHIMKIYSAHGINEFVICLGYKGYMIKEYFLNYRLRMSNVMLNLQEDSIEFLDNESEPWKITLINTGENFGTGGRLKNVLPLLDKDESFHFTYGDGVGPINIGALEKFHQSHGRLATVTATLPPRRFGLMRLEDSVVKKFDEKPKTKQDWVNGGFFVLSPKVGDLIKSNSTYWEEEPMRELVSKNELRAFRHDGYWQPMDTLRDRETLENLWSSGSAPWKVWK